MYILVYIEVNATSLPQITTLAQPWTIYLMHFKKNIVLIKIKKSNSIISYCCLHNVKLLIGCLDYDLSNELFVIYIQNSLLQPHSKNKLTIKRQPQKQNKSIHADE